MGLFFLSVAAVLFGGFHPITLHGGRTLWGEHLWILYHAVTIIKEAVKFPRFGNQRINGINQPIILANGLAQPVNRLFDLIGARGQCHVKTVQRIQLLLLNAHRVKKPGIAIAGCADAVNQHLQLLHGHIHIVYIAQTCPADQLLLYAIKPLLFGL